MSNVHLATSKQELEETADMLDKIVAGKEAYDELASDDQFQDTLTLLERIAECKEAYDELPSNEELEETSEIIGSIGLAQKVCLAAPDAKLEATAEILERICIAKKAYDELPSNDELDAVIAKLERIVELQAKVGDS